MTAVVRARCQLTLCAAAVLVLVAVLPTPPAVLQAVDTAAPGDPGLVDTAALLVASLTVWALVGWGVAVLLAALLARIPGTVGRWAGAMLRRAAPAAVRRVLIAGAGLSLVAGAAACSTEPAPDAGGQQQVVTAVSASAPVEAGRPEVGARPAGSTGWSIRSGLGSGLAWFGPVAQGSAVPAGDAGSASGPGTGITPNLDWPVASPAAPDLDWPEADSPGGTQDPIPAEAGPTPGPASGSDQAATPTGSADRTAGSPGSAHRAAGPTAEPVVVLAGDTLWSIAATHLGAGAGTAEIDAAWRAWYSANRDVIGADPDLILPGQRLRPPPADALGALPASDAAEHRSPATPSPTAHSPAAQPPSG